MPTQAEIEAANQAMRAIADDPEMDTNTKIDRIEAIWEPIALALCPRAMLARSFDDSTIMGRTSDSGKIVSVGEPEGDVWRYVPFVIHD